MYTACDAGSCAIGRLSPLGPQEVSPMVPSKTAIRETQPPRSFKPDLACSAFSRAGSLANLIARKPTQRQLVGDLRRISVDAYVRLIPVGVISRRDSIDAQCHERWYALPRHRKDEIMCWAAYQSNDYTRAIDHEEIVFPKLSGAKARQKTWYGKWTVG